MSTIQIKDLDRDETLDTQAMRAVLGGSKSGNSASWLPGSGHAPSGTAPASRLIPGLMRRPRLDHDALR